MITWTVWNLGAEKDETQLKLPSEIDSHEKFRYVMINKIIRWRIVEVETF